MKLTFSIRCKSCNTTAAKFLFFIILFLLPAGCKEEVIVNSCIDETKINPGSLCPTLYDPVCGCDGKDYGNECLAINAGVLSWTKGECN